MADKKTETNIRAKSLEDAVKQCNVNILVWEVDTFSTKELSSGEYLFTIYFKRRKPLIDWDLFKKDLIEYAPSFEKKVYPNKKDSLLWEFSVPDAHINKFSWREECGENYDIKIAARLYRKTVDDALNRIKAFNVEKIIFPVGNDYLHFDNLESTTTAGTPQDGDSRHLKMFREGYKILIETILKLQEVAPVEVISVLGNHSTVSEMHIAELLSIYFRNNPQVKVDTSAFPRKYIKYGVNLIGFAHGNLEKHIKLPLIMATERPKDWATSTTKIWHLGHLHQQRIMEDCGVIIEILPSISATDSWHSKKGYIGNTRAGMSFLYDKQYGLVARFYHKV